jgi:hypothetical protein
MWRYVGLVRADVSEKRVVSIFRTEKSVNEKLRKYLAESASSRILSVLKIKVKRSSETSVLTRSTWSHIPEDGILHVLMITDFLLIPSELRYIRA